MGARLKSWARTVTKLVLLILAYFWIGAGYKLIYAQTHDTTRLSRIIPFIPYYRQQFLLDTLLHITWVWGPEFNQFLGDIPSLGDLVSGRGSAVLVDWTRRRDRELASLPDRYPYGLFGHLALEDDSLLYSQGSAVLPIITLREPPSRIVARAEKENGWRSQGVPDTSRPAELARRLADTYPDSPQAPAALVRVAQSEEQQGRLAESQAIYRRVASEYPRSPQTQEAASALARAAAAAGNLEEARDYERRGLVAAERAAREEFAGKALPARNTIAILGFRVDLSGMELQLQRVAAAQELVAVASRDVDRLKALRGLPGDAESELRSSRERLEKMRNELWISDLYSNLKVGTPGPPPQPQSHTVSGVVLVDGKPLPNAEVGLEDPNHRVRPEAIMLGQLGELRLRNRTDGQGRYAITQVPSGHYTPVLIYPARAPQAGGAPVAPVADAATGGVPPEVTVADKDLQLPPVRLASCVEGSNFGEQSATGKNLRLSWKPWPGAAAYRVKILASPVFAAAFEARAGAAKRDEFRRHPVLWSAPRTAETQVECPLLSLAPDAQQALPAVQYEYSVVALDASGRALATTSAPLSRFTLSRAAQEALLRQKPTFARRGFVPGRRRGGRGLFGGRRPSGGPRNSP